MAGETIEDHRDWRGFWESIGERTSRDDHFGQVGRTVGGKPVSSEQTPLLVEAIRQALELEPSDVLLDLCCGNGLITVALAPLCRWIVAADFSLELIDTARERFSAANIVYLHRAVEELEAGDFTHGAPTKVCMNGALQHFTEAGLNEVLTTIGRLRNDRLVLSFTDVPDADRLSAFYDSPERRAAYERRRAEGSDAMGTWWSREHLAAIMEAAGYEVSFPPHDPRRFTSHYRFDLCARAV